MQQKHWQTIALFALSLLVLTNAAGFYTRRAMEADYAGRIAEASCPKAATLMTQTSDAPEIHYLPGAFDPDRREAPPTSALPRGERCIAGQRFRKTGSNWEQLGSC
jgi:hypothetical protein